MCHHSTFFCPCKCASRAFRQILFLFSYIEAKEAIAIYCAIYVRLSKEDELHPRAESESIQNQKALLTCYAAEHGWDIYEIYCDEDFSGADGRRPAFLRMLAAAEAGAFRILLCKSQSRFTRDIETAEKYIHKLFPRWGIRFIAVTDHADSELKGNRKSRQIMALVNEWYLEDLSENIRLVLDAKRLQGQYIASSPLYGYQKDPLDHNRLLPAPEEAAVVRQIFRWAQEGCGCSEIARRLTRAAIPTPSGEAAPWRRQTVWSILRNEMYTGVMIQGRSRKAAYHSKTLLRQPESQWFRVEGTHAALIDRACFQQVQTLLSLRTRPDGGGSIYPLSGLVHCLDCGSPMNRTSNGSKTIFYLRWSRYAVGSKDNRCTRHSIRLDQLLRQVSEEVRRHASLPPQLSADPLPRELFLRFIRRIEIGERSPESGRQEIRIHWRSP